MSGPVYIIMRQVPNGCCLDLNLMTNTVLQQTIFRCFQMKFFSRFKTKLYKHIWKKIILNCIPTTFIHYIKKFLKH